MSLTSFYNKKSFRRALYRKSKRRFYIKYFFSKARAVYEIMSKNVVEQGGPQMTSQYGVYKFHVGLARLHARVQARACTCPHARKRVLAHTHRQICNTYCFSTPTVVPRTQLSVTLYVRCLSCSPITSVFDCQHHSIYVPYTSSSTRYSYYKDKSPGDCQRAILFAKSGSN
jgi:hypothetical protein